jgi:hypothetical protein
MALHTKLPSKVFPLRIPTVSVIGLVSPFRVTSPSHDVPPVILAQSMDTTAEAGRGGTGDGGSELALQS